jgi:stearoyl-CoA desaturase (Delta-9 desaturase)
MLELTAGKQRRAVAGGIDYCLLAQVFFVHGACLLVWRVGFSPAAVAACLALYAVRMFGVTAGYHRYFAHRAYQTGRLFQFLIGFLATTSYQRGPLWWAAHHRYHHIHSDTEADIHSPVQDGFWWSHFGWLLYRRNGSTDLKMIPNLVKYPELHLLNAAYPLPPLMLAASVFLFGEWLGRAAPELGTSGPQMLVWGFFMSTVLLYHATFMLTSLTHIVGQRAFDTGDNSRNSFLIALVTFGEGWHNNHHYCPSSERQGFYWWEVDISHYVLRLLSWAHVVWALQSPPKRVYAAERSAARRGLAG